MEIFRLVSAERQECGKGAARKLRKLGKVPAVIYGHGEEPTPLSVGESEVRKLLHSRGESALLKVTIKGKVKREYDAIVREFQVHPATGKILHVDFQRISLDEKVRVEVPVVLRGSAKGVKETGGILEHGLRELNIMCVPTLIPERIEVDVSEMEIGDSIHVREISSRYPEIEFLDEEGSTLAIVVPPAVEVAPPTLEEAPEEPELVKKEREEEKGEETQEASEK